MPKKILHIVPDLPTDGNALAEFACNLAKAQVSAGCEVVIAATAGENLAVVAFEAEEMGVRIGRFKPSGARHFSREMLTNLRKVVRGAETVHVHGLRSFPVWFGCFCALVEKKHLVVSPHGGFNPEIMKHLPPADKFLAPLDLLFMKRAEVIHAASSLEESWILAQPLLKKSADRIVVAQPGIELPRLMPKMQEHDSRTLLFFGNLERVNGPDLLLDALAQCDAHRNCRLILCGADTGGIRRELEEQIERLGIGKKVEFREPVTGMAKWRLFREADCVVFPTRGDNFGTTVAEALACGLPVISTEAGPWKCLAEAQCGWCCGTSADGIAVAIRDMLYHYDEELAEMGDRGKKFAEKQFSWNVTAEALS